MDLLAWYILCAGCSGTISGIELIDGDCCQWTSTIGAAVKACGGIHSILHSSGEGKWQIHTQQLSNAALTGGEYNRPVCKRA